MKRYLRLLSIPLTFLVIYTSLAIAWRIFSLPPADVLAEIVGGWFDRYGTPALFFSSMLEGLLLIGSYFPGVFVIFLGVLVADNPMEAVVSVAVCTLGLVIAHIVNYILGKYGWYRILIKFGMSDAVEQSRIKLERRGLWAIPLSYWLPSVGALTNTAAGIMRLQFRKFLLFSVISSVFWYSLVGLIVYVSGEKALEVAGGGSANVYVFGVIVIWILILLIVDYRNKERNNDIISS